MLISVRGTNGSGKSTVVQGLLKLKPALPIFGVLGTKRPEAYRLKLEGLSKPIYVLGPYHVASGGCDQIQPYDLILDLLGKYAPKGHVVFEGVIVSSSYGRVGRLMETYGKEAVMAFLSTPLEDCIKNVQKRRDAKADARPFNPANLTSKYNQIVGSRVKMLAEDKLRVVDLLPETALAQILALLGECE